MDKPEELVAAITAEFEKTAQALPPLSDEALDAFDAALRNSEASTHEEQQMKAAMVHFSRLCRALNVLHEVPPAD